MKYSIKNFFSKCHQIRSFLGIWSHLLKKYLMENFIFCAVDDDDISYDRDGFKITEKKQNSFYLTH